MQIAEMWRLLRFRIPDSKFRLRPGRSRRRQRPAVGRHPARPRARAIPTSTHAARLHLVEASAAARAAQPAIARRCCATGWRRRQRRVAGVVRGRADRERAARRVAGASGGDARGRPARGVRPGQTRTPGRSDERLRLVEGPPSTPALAAYLDRLGVSLEPGWRVEINLRAVEWIRDAARRLTSRLHHPDRLRPRGARALFAVARRRHADDLRAASRAPAPNGRRPPAWLRTSRRPGHHRARRLHQRPRGGRSRRADDARLPRPDLLPARAADRRTGVACGIGGRDGQAAATRR